MFSCLPAIIDFSWKFLLGKKNCQVFDKSKSLSQADKNYCTPFYTLSREQISWLNLCHSKNYLCLRDDRKFPTSVTNTSSRLSKFALWTQHASLHPQFKYKSVAPTAIRFSTLVDTIWMFSSKPVGIWTKPSYICVANNMLLYR